MTYGAGFIFLSRQCLLVLLTVNHKALAKCIFRIPDRFQYISHTQYVKSCIKTLKYELINIRPDVTGEVKAMHENTVPRYL